MRKLLLLLFVFCIAGSFMPAANAATRTKTVEYFALGSDNSIDAAHSNYSNAFDVYIPENGIVIKDAYIEAHIVKEDTGAARIVKNIVGLNKSIIVAEESQSDREIMRSIVIANASSKNGGSNGASLFDITGKPGLHHYNISMSSDFSDNRNAAAKLVITYDYDDTSPIQLKTVKFFVNNTQASIAAAATLRNDFNITLPEAQPNVTSAWFEVTGFADDQTAATYTFDLNGTNLPEGAPAFGSLLEPTDFVFFINATANGNGLSLYTMNQSGANYKWYLTAKPTGNQLAGFSAIAVVTYAYNNSATENELRTLEYFVFSNTNTSVAATTSSTSEGNVTVSIAENVTQVHDAFIRWGAIQDGDGLINMDVSINGTLARTGDNIKPNSDTATAEAASMNMFIDARMANGGASPSDLKGMSPSGIYQITAACTTDACWNTWAKLFVTYEFTRNGTTMFTETAKHWVMNRTQVLTAGNAETRSFTTQFAGSNHSVKSSFFSIETLTQGDPVSPTQQYCHQLNSTQLPVECDKVPGEGFVYTLAFLKNASSQNGASPPTLYDITKNGTYYWSYSFKTIGEDTFGASAQLLTTYFYSAPTHETNLSTLGAGVTNISWGGSNNNQFTAACDVTVTTSPSFDVYLILEHNSTSDGSWTQLPVAGSAGSHPFSVPDGDPAAYLCGNVAPSTTCTKSWTVSGNAIRSEAGIRCRSNSTDSPDDDSLSQKQSYINVRGGNLTVFISDPVVNLSMGIAEHRNITVNVTCANFYCGDFNITWETNNTGQAPNINMSAVTDLMNTSLALQACAGMDVNSICNLTTNTNLSLGAGDYTPATKQYRAIVYALANISNNASTTQKFDIYSGQINVTFVAPADGFNFVKDITTANGIEVNITCMNYNCRELRGLTYYHPTGGASTTTLIPTDTSGNLQVSVPAANTEASPNTECGSINVNSSCILNWDVTGIALQDNMPVNVTVNSTHFNGTRMNYTLTKPLVNVKSLVLYVNLTVPLGNESIGKTHTFNITCSVNASGIQADDVYLRPQADFGSGFVNISTADVAGDDMKANASAVLCGNIAVSSAPCAANWTLTGREISQNTQFRCYANSTVLNNASNIRYNASIYVGNLSVVWLVPAQNDTDVQQLATQNVTARIDCSSYYCGSVNWTLHTNNSATNPAYPVNSTTNIALDTGSNPYSCGLVDTNISVNNCTNSILVKMRVGSTIGVRRRIRVAATSNDSDVTAANSSVRSLIGISAVLFIVKVSVQPVLDRGDNASIIITFTDSGGVLTSASTVNTTVFFPNGSVALYARATKLETGRYNMTYLLPGNAPYGTYRINVNASESSIAYGDASFELRPKGLDVQQNETLFNISTITNTLNSTLLNQSNFGSLSIENLLNDINSTKNILRSLIVRQEDFTQEEIFLITDAMNTIDSITASLSAGSITDAEAQNRLDEIKKSLSAITGKAPAAAPIMPVINLLMAAGGVAGTSLLLLRNKLKIKLRRRNAKQSDKADKSESDVARKNTVALSIGSSVQKIKSVLLDKKFINNATDSLAEKHAKAKHHFTLFSQKRKIEKQIAELKQRLQSNYSSFSAGAMTIDEYTNRRECLQEQLRQISEKQTDDIERREASKHMCRQSTGKVDENAN